MVRAYTSPSYNFVAHIVVAYLPRKEVLRIRENTGPVVSPDILDEDDGFATLKFDFGKCLHWTNEYEHALGSMPPSSLIEKLKRYPADWISSQDDPNEFSTSISNYGLDQRAKSGSLEDKKLLAWKQHTRNVQYHREAYMAAKTKFFSSWTLQISTGTSASTTKRKQADKRAAKKSENIMKYLLPSPPSLTEPKRGVHYHPFLGKGRDGPRIFNCAGNIHAIPPIEDIPGWQRITMIKRCNDYTEWCYEGLVFPGNMIMVGRWWKKDDDAERAEIGPFIYWNVSK